MSVCGMCNNTEVRLWASKLSFFEYHAFTGMLVWFHVYPARDFASAMCLLLRTFPFRLLSHSEPWYPRWVWLLFVGNWRSTARPWVGQGSAITNWEIGCRCAQTIAFQRSSIRNKPTPDNGRFLQFVPSIEPCWFCWWWPQLPIYCSWASSLWQPNDRGKAPPSCSQSNMLKLGRSWGHCDFWNSKSERCCCRFIGQIAML